MTAGSRNAQISCSVEYGDFAYYYTGMCYAPNGESFHDLNVTDSCVKVGRDPSNLQYNDSTIQLRPDWRVSFRDEPVVDCVTRRTTTLEIPRVSMANNNGIVYCIWQDITKQFVYEQHNLRVREPAPTWIRVNWKYIALGGGLATGSVALVVLLLVITSLRSWKKARRAESKLKRRRESKRRSHSLPRPEPPGR